MSAPMQSRRAPRPELRARVLELARATPAPTRERHARTTMLAVALFAAGAVLSFFVMGGTHAGARPWWLVAGTSLGAAAVAVVVTRLATGSPLPGGAPSMLGPSQERLRAVVLATLVALAAVAVGSALAGSELAAADAPRRATDLACAAMSVAQGVLPLLALAWPRRSADPLDPALTGAAIGAAAGAWAGMLAWLRCPHVSLAHGLLAHALPALVLAGIGALVGSRLLRMR